MTHPPSPPDLNAAFAISDSPRSTPASGLPADAGSPDASAAILDGVMQATRMAIWLADAGSLELIDFHSPGGRHAEFGLAPEQVAPGVRWTDNVYPPDRAAVFAHGQQSLSQLAGSSVDYRLMVGDGDLLWIRHWTIARHTMTDGRVVLRNIFVPVVEQKQLEWECLRVSERECNRIGQELHDDLCQVLAGLLFMLRVIAQRARPADPAVAHEIEELAHHFGDTTDRVRSMAHGLFPAQLRHASAVAALEACACELRKLFRIEVAVQLDADLPRHDPVQIIHLYRIVQESVANAVRHGGATTVRIGLKRNGEQLALEVEDNGAGMPAVGGQPEGIGVHVMQYRAHALGGACEFRPASPHGVVVHVDYPVNPTAMY